MADLLAGMRILILEDEFLIAMDLEQLCRDHGAAEIAIVNDLSEIQPISTLPGFDAAILDVMLGGTSTLAFARLLHQRKVPFIFSSGYTDLDQVFNTFPDITVVSKPYAGSDLIRALAVAAGRLPASGGI